jgi:ferritin-like protein
MADENIIVQLLIKYFNEEKVTTGILVLLSLVVNGIQSQGISRITAEIVQSIEKQNQECVQQLDYQNPSKNNKERFKVFIKEQ